MILNATRLSLGLICLAIVAGTAAANDLNDGMQLFFDAKYQDALQKLTSLVEQGPQDARVYYFRGLVNRRLGNAEAAIADFEKGAAIELNDAGYGVGEALQRVQGSERLLLEKHRTLARLVARDRSQPLAPKPAVADDKGEIQLATAESMTSAPTFRLASEIPLRTPVAIDPVADDESSIAAGQRMPSGPLVAPSAETDNKDQPVGTGVAVIEQTDGAFDPFSEPGEATAADLSAANRIAVGQSSSNQKTTRVLAAVFRAFTKSTIPRFDKLVSPSLVPTSTTPEAKFDVGDDVFGDETESDDPFGDDVESDPFGGN